MSRRKRNKARNKQKIKDNNNAQSKVQNFAHNKENNTKKDQNMAWWNTGTQRGRTKGLVGFNPNITKPKVTTQNSTLSIMVYKQSVLDEIAAICKPHANASEFQVHCRGAQIFIQKPDSTKRIVFTIPTFFFNMPQKVSSGSVDFNLDEVAAISNQLSPMSIKMVEDIVAKFPTDFFENLGFEVSVRELEMGSLHRHPGDFGFSGTDLDNQVQKPGVIFRNLKCQDKVQVDSVMYIPGDHVKIVTTETRVVSVEPSEDEGISGTYAETPTLCYILQDKIEPLVGFSEFFNPEVNVSESEMEFSKGKYKCEENYPEIEEVLTIFLKNMDYEPQLIIDPELIEEEYAYYNYRNSASNTYGRNKSFYDADDDDGYVIPSPNTTAANKTSLVIRPTWRKTQALSLLKAKGIDVASNPDITGDASDKDIIAIVTEFKNNEMSNLIINTFFTTCGYPKDAMDIYYASLISDKLV